jgi:hypothetical protein
MTDAERWLAIVMGVRVRPRLRGYDAVLADVCVSKTGAGVCGWFYRFCDGTAIATDASGDPRNWVAVDAGGRRIVRALPPP